MIKEMIEWLDSHPNESKEIYEQKQQELQSKLQPLFQGMYHQQGSAPQGGNPYQQPHGGNQSSTSGKGPTIEEVD